MMPGMLCEMGVSADRLISNQSLILLHISNEKPVKAKATTDEYYVYSTLYSLRYHVTLLVVIRQKGV